MRAYNLQGCPSAECRREAHSGAADMLASATSSRVTEYPLSGWSADACPEGPGRRVKAPAAILDRRAANMPESRATVGAVATVATLRHKTPESRPDANAKVAADRRHPPALRHTPPRSPPRPAALTFRLTGF